MTNHNQGGGLRRIWNAGLYSLAGIRAAWQNEAAFRQEMLLGLILIPAAFWYGSTQIRRLHCEWPLKLGIERIYPMERTLSIVKPDGVSRGLIGEVVKRLEANELKIAAMKMIHMTKTQAE